jgi:hypothetical protein
LNRRGAEKDYISTAARCVQVMFRLAIHGMIKPHINAVKRGQQTKATRVVFFDRRSSASIGG